jgi:hypothetical protein
MLWTLRLACPALLLLLAAGALAQPTGGAALNWVRMPGAERCIGSVELSGLVEERLGRNAFVRPPDALVLIVGRVSPRPPAGFVAVIRVSNARGEVHGSREIELDDSDCARMGEVVALVIALTLRADGEAGGIELPAEVEAELDALFQEEPSELDAARLPAAPPDRATRGQAAPARATVPERAPEEAALRLSLDLGAMAESGLQPDGTLGGVLRAELEIDRSLGVGLGASLALPRGAPVDDERGELSFQPSALSLSLCMPSLALLQSRLSLCAVTELGLVRVEAEGFAVSNGSSSKAWVAFAPMASVRVPVLGALYVRLGVRLPLRVTRPRFSYRRQDGTLPDPYSTAPVGIAAELALGAAL